MSSNILNTIILSGAYLTLFISAEIFYHQLKLKAEVTRKYVHIITGLLSMLFPVLLSNHWYVFMLCLSFLLILLISLKYHYLPSINGVERKTHGSILYPIIVYTCFYVYQYFDQYMFYYIPILILAICDPIAALVGKKWPWLKYTTFGMTKTLSGSIGFFVSCFLICFLLLQFIEEIELSLVLLLSLVIAFFTTIAEAITHKGYDNLSIPMVALGILILFTNFFI